MIEDGAAGPTGAPMNETPRIAVIGCGYWGKNLVRNFHEAGALAAVSDASPELARGFAEQYGVPYLSYDEVLNEETIDAVAIATPAISHAGLALQALASGKDVFCEKPLAIDLADAEAVVSSADGKGRVLMVGHLLQYHPVFLKMKAMVDSGDVGAVRYMYSNRLNLGKVRREENILWSFAPHDISMILALAGEEPSSISAVGATYLREGVADVTMTHLSFASGIRAHIFVSWLHPYKEQRLVVVGEKAMLVFDDTQPWDRKLTAYDHGIRLDGDVTELTKADGRSISVEQFEPLRAECDHFLECVRTRQSPRTDGAEALAVLRVLQAAEQLD